MLLKAFYPEPNLFLCCLGGLGWGGVKEKDAPLSLRTGFLVPHIPNRLVKNPYLTTCHSPTHLHPTTLQAAQLAANCTLSNDQQHHYHALAANPDFRKFSSRAPGYCLVFREVEWPAVASAGVRPCSSPDGLLILGSLCTYIGQPVDLLWLSLGAFHHLMFNLIISGECL